ncbi:MAG: AAC(3) family N-acetyltransferase [Candidatus Aerophobetes bacterium]|nr:AAC(3) family N-acetyltransferase [Candidatus Aerophobetes bacterium]
MRVTKDRIKKDLQTLGLKKGDRVFMHSSLKSVGYVKGGADTVIDAIMEVVGEDGLLMVPTFTFKGFIPYFEPHRTPSEMGLITEALRQRKESVRSWHPRHSVGVIGKNAKKVVKDHLKAGSLGKGSPPDKLAKRGGYALLLGVGHNVNSTIHTAEVYAELSYLYTVKDSPDFPEQAIVKTPAEEMIKVDLPPFPTCSEGFWKLEPVMRDRGKIRYGKVGQAHSQLMKSQDVIDTASSLLREDPGALLCDEPECYPCNEKRKVIRSLSDSSQEKEE